MCHVDEPHWLMTVNLFLQIVMEDVGGTHDIVSASTGGACDVVAAIGEATIGTGVDHSRVESCIGGDGGIPSVGAIGDAKS